jgi:hypothetical protein
LRSASPSEVAATLRRTTEVRPAAEDHERAEGGWTPDEEGAR